MNARDLWLRVRAIVRPGAVEHDLQDELAFHVEMQTRKHVAAGLSGPDARRRALAEFGSGAFVEDECRDARGIGWFETLLQDVRYAVRGFRRAPIFALTVIATIALGLGLNTAIFTIFNAYVLKPFEVRDPWSLYEMSWRSRAGDRSLLTWPEARQLARETDVFSETYADERGVFVERVEGHTAYVVLVTGNYFRMLGVDAAAGRVLQPSDSETPGGEPVVVISHDLWRRQFGGDPAIIGRTIAVHGCRCEIVGVAREGFGGLDGAPPSDIWAPITLAGAFDEGPDLFGPTEPRRLTLVGRLRPGVTVGAARAALRTRVSAATPTPAPDQRPIDVMLESRATSIPLTPPVLAALSPLLIGVALVLLIACANVANMMLARGLARQREIGIRLTLGAARRRLIRQMLTESLALALPAAALGFAISRAGIKAGVWLVYAVLPPESAEFVRVGPLLPDARVFAFMVLAAVAAGVLFGLAPALQATRASVVSMARGDFAAEFGPSRLRHALIVAQITATAMLLITAAVLLRGVQRVSRIETGFRTTNIVTVDVHDRWRRRALEILNAHSAVKGVAAASAVPLEGMAPGVSVSAEGRDDLRRVRYRFVSPGYFDVFDIPIVRGRPFTTEEARSGAGLAIISETAARQLWPSGDPVGHWLRVVPESWAPATARIRHHARVMVIGVARDTAADLERAGPATATIHFPVDPSEAGLELIVRVAADAEAVRQSLDSALTRDAPGGVREIHAMSELVAWRLFPFRAAYWMAGAVGVLALLLTLTGVYGVLSYLVTQRTREIGIRVALGASASVVVALVMRQSLRLAATGLSIGGALAIGFGRLVASRMILIDPSDATAFIGGALVVALACVCAAGFPAFRATRIDPMTTLRAD